MIRIACIGSRVLDDEALALLERIGEYLAKNGYTVVSGNAPGGRSGLRPRGKQGRVEQVIAWPIPRPGGGGTGHAIRVASALGIPVIDLSTGQGQQRVLAKLDAPEQ